MDRPSLAIAAMVVAVAAVRPLVHESIADGMMGNMLQSPPAVEPHAAKPGDGVSAVVSALTSASPAPVVTAAWPGFRGAQRDDVIRGVRIATDWAAT